MGKHGVKSASRVQLPYWHYISGYTITNPDNQAVTIPSTATIVRIASENGDTYYAINAALAGATAPGHIATDEYQDIGPLGNLTTLYVHGTAAITHIQFFREV